MNAEQLADLDALIAACEKAFAGEQMKSFDDDEDVSEPPTGITFGMIRNARAAVTLEIAEVERLRLALERVYQSGSGPHVEIAREALNA